MPFKKGEGGRPKGAGNKATAEVKAWAKRFFTSKVYRDSAQSRMLSGRAPHLESYLLQLYAGKPRESMDLEVSGELSGLVHVIHEHQAST